MSDRTARGPRRPLHLVFMVLLGLGGWSILAAAYGRPDLGPGAGVDTAAPLPIAIFAIVIVATRGMAFPLFPKTVVSLDSAFYVAAAVCLGSVTAGLLVAFALTLDSIFRLFTAAGAPEDRPRDRVESIVYIFYFGGMTGALLMISAWLFRVDGLPLAPEMSPVDVLGRVVGVGFTLLVAHYVVQAARLKLAGESFAWFFRRTTLPGMVTEASLLPLAAVVVYLYHPQEPLGLSLLGATFILINFAFSRLTRMRAQLQERVTELETLNATSRRLAASLERQELVEVVARETLRAIPEADALTLSHRDSEASGDDLVVDHYDRERGRFERLRAPAAGTAPGWVIARGETTALPDLRESELAPATGAGAGAWVGVPIVIYGGVEGALGIYSRRAGAVGADHDVRLLESISAQATVALQNARLYELAMIDGLTGLFVRRYFDARLEEEIERARRYDTGFSVVMMDIDNFKELNDTRGHPVGDRVLRRLAATASREMRAVDTAARYGGEEVAMILPRTGVVEAYNVAERIRREIEAAEHDDGVTVTASLGVASYPESGAEGGSGLVALADRALYRAKRTGKNRVEIYWPEEDGRAAEEPQKV